MSRTTWPPADALDDRCPTQPIAVVPPARRARSGLLTVLVVVAVVVAVVTGVVGHLVTATSPPPTVSALPAPTTTRPSPHAGDVARPSPPPRSDERRPERRGALGLADGAVPDGVTVFDDDVPAVAELDPDLLAALREAATDAADDRVAFVVNSGWRSAAYQERLLDEAISRYGSKAEAARWVATPDTSPHVSGDAVDLAASAAAWLSEHGAEHGLCQVYRNEPWHFELRPDAADRGCPRMYADPTHDPRMK